MIHRLAKKRLSSSLNTGCDGHGMNPMHLLPYIESFNHMSSPFIQGFKDFYYHCTEHSKNIFQQLLVVYIV